MKKLFTGMAAAFLAAALMSGATAWAAAGEQSINVNYRDIQTYVDGAPVTLLDAIGNEVEPFIYNGTVYLPIRAVSALAGREVSWDDETSSVYIGTAPAASDAKTFAKEDTPIIVSDVKLISLSWNVTVPGVRGGIPAVITVPADEEGPFPVVILAHGHGGSKDEAGGFVVLSNSLAAAGIASIRIDFPGCGDSEEDFVTQNNISNMLVDLELTRKYLAEDTRFNNLGILGYSMGGRLAMLTIGMDETYEFSPAALWAPAGTPGASDMFTFMQLDGQSEFDALYETATKEGEVTYTSIFGFEQTLGKQWFDDMLAYDPTLNWGFKGDLLTIYGDLDIIIPPETAKAAAEAAKGNHARSSVVYKATGADHGFGIYSDEPELLQSVVDQTVQFFVDKFGLVSE